MVSLRQRARRQAARILCAGLAVLCFPLAAFAQDVSEASLKAAYIHKFVQFTEWPVAALPAGAPISLCVVGDIAIRDALERTVKNVTVSGRPLAVAYGTPDRLPKLCHVMYVSAISRAQVATALAPYRGQPVLTMSDIEGFNGLGGIVELFYEDASLVFSIRLDELKRSGIQLSARLLALARRR